MTKSEALRVRVTPGELTALRSMAEDRSCSVGAVVRWAVRKAVLADPPGGQSQRNGESAVLVQSAGAAPLVQS